MGSIHLTDSAASFLANHPARSAILLEQAQGGCFQPEERLIRLATREMVDPAFQTVVEDWNQTIDSMRVSLGLPAAVSKENVRGIAQEERNAAIAELEGIAQEQCIESERAWRSRIEGIVETHTTRARERIEERLDRFEQDLNNFQWFNLAYIALGVFAAALTGLWIAWLGRLARLVIGLIRGWRMLGSVLASLGVVESVAEAAEPDVRERAAQVRDEFKQKARDRILARYQDAREAGEQPPDPEAVGEAVWSELKPEMEAKLEEIAESTTKEAALPQAREKVCANARQSAELMLADMRDVARDDITGEQKANVCRNVADGLSARENDMDALRAAGAEPCADVVDQLDEIRQLHGEHC